jgi:hypothetical protein
MDYFAITHHQQLCSVADKLEYWLIDFDERNELPKGYSTSETSPRDLQSLLLFRIFGVMDKIVGNS